MRIESNSLNQSYNFEPVELRFDRELHKNIFALKNNKTLQETLNHKRYMKLKSESYEKYLEFLDWPLGKFLYHLKLNCDQFYKQFLNRYGDLTYSNFVISDNTCFSLKGIYAYSAGDELKYIGRCRDSMKKRINQGYGKIHPKNCYLDGQATNCHLNALITEAKSEICLWLKSMEDNAEIEQLEKLLIADHAPAWNLQRY